MGIQGLTGILAKLNLRCDTPSLPRRTGRFIINGVGSLRCYNATKEPDNYRVNFQHLCVDGNDLLYKAWCKAQERLPTTTDVNEFTDSVAVAFMEDISEILQEIDCSRKQSLKIVIVADGIVPYAKQHIQRHRRLSGHSTSHAFSTTQITPGTHLISVLERKLIHYASSMYGDRCIFSLWDVAGEGEHKIVKYTQMIREKGDNSTVLMAITDGDILCINALSNLQNVVIRRAYKQGDSMKISYLVCDHLKAQCERTAGIVNWANFAIMMMLEGNDFIPKTIVASAHGLFAQVAVDVMSKFVTPDPSTWLFTNCTLPRMKMQLVGNKLVNIPASFPESAICVDLVNLSRLINGIACRQIELYEDVRKTVQSGRLRHPPTFDVTVPETVNGVAIRDFVMQWLSRNSRIRPEAYACPIYLDNVMVLQYLTMVIWCTRYYQQTAVPTSSHYSFIVAPAISVIDERLRRFISLQAGPNGMISRGEMLPPGHTICKRLACTPADYVDSDVHPIKEWMQALMVLPKHHWDSVMDCAGIHDYETRMQIRMCIPEDSHSFTRMVLPAGSIYDDAEGIPDLPMLFHDSIVNALSRFSQFGRPVV